MKKSVRFWGILLSAALVAGSWAYAQQTKQNTQDANISKKEIIKEKPCAKDSCCNICLQKDKSRECGKSECCKWNCRKPDYCKADCCSMKSDSTKQCCNTMMHDSKKHGMGCCEKLKKGGCEKMMKIKGEQN